MNDVPAAMSNASIMVNATPLGMTGKPPMIPDVIDGLANVDANATVFDTVYAPLETGLLRHSRKIGLHTVGGLSMLVGRQEKRRVGKGCGGTDRTRGEPCQLNK